MFVILIEDVDSSSHTLEVDAQAQKQRFIDNGVSEESISIVEKETFAPVQE